MTDLLALHKQTMKNILGALEKSLARRGAHCRINTEGNLLHVYIHGANGAWVCQAICDQQRNQFIFYSVYPFRVPAGYRNEACALMAGLNYDQAAVCFEMQLGTGTVRCRAGLTLDASRNGDVPLEDIVLPNILAADVFWPLLRRVGEGRLTAAKAIAMAQRQRGNR
jgi:hypothetical protein